MNRDFGDVDLVGLRPSRMGEAEVTWSGLRISANDLGAGPGDLVSTLSGALSLSNIGLVLAGGCDMERKVPYLWWGDPT